MILAQAITVAVRGRTIIPALDLAFEGPGWLGIVGANGSGKTTLLRALCGRLPIEGGSLMIDGNDLTHDRAARARRIALAPEGHRLPDSITGEELLAIAAGTPGWRDREGGLDPLYRALGLEAFIHRPIGTYSAGMRQRLAIFCPFATGASTIILDEPFNWLDSVAAFDAKQALRTLSRERHTLITALHDLPSLYHLCDQGILLAGGMVRLRLAKDQLAASGRGAEQFEQDVIQHLRGADS